MAHRAFRFLQAGDFHLEQPLQGSAGVPPQFGDLFLDAPYAAATKIFEIALAEEVAFLVLTGDLLDARYTGPRGPLFLVEQFERLAAKEIPVYWAGSPIEPPDAWPEVLRLPGNVHRLPINRLAEHLIERAGEPLVRLIGTSRDGSRPLRPSEFDADPTGLFTVGAAYGEADAAALHARRLHYWALGGQHERSTTLSGNAAVYFAGTPQGRRPEEHGPHGCTLVHVENQTARTTAIATDVVRWHNERVLVDETTSREQLTARLREHVERLIATAAGLDLLVTWTLSGHGPLLQQLRRPGASESLLNWLRGEFGLARPAVWTVDLVVESLGGLPAEWYDEESIRGDFLRELRQFELNADASLGLEDYLSERQRAGELSVVANVHGPDRPATLREAALLGIDLLTGEESKS